MVVAVESREEPMRKTVRSSKDQYKRETGSSCRVSVYGHEA